MAVANSAINFSGVPKGVRTPVAEAGEHTVQVLRSVGYSELEIGNMRAKGVI